MVMKWSCGYRVTVVRSTFWRELNPCILYHQRRRAAHQLQADLPTPPSPTTTNLYNGKHSPLTPRHWDLFFPGSGRLSMLHGNIIWVTHAGESPTLWLSLSCVRITREEERRSVTTI
ncbi:unnamed protein product [Allacma fusca]|uniref:Uncharacterized protein n=1 Tax=Allacma fusca TaxID=39272 RepID=A0A8J2LAW0_9HEXA|nr:unnamed protein product [Allacma fusca]